MKNKKEKINSEENKEAGSSEFPEAKISRIKCLTFCSKNETIEAYTKVLNEEKNTGKKIYFAETLIKEADWLLNCQYFNRKKLDCRICRKISELRKKTAELIIKAQKLT